ncbi:hypothetical protein V1520DRAFT_335068 [Lipomyces starkeyi]|uniref:Protein KRE1 n=1 Tax=Lipomyces starkeyi NRRL Y-11557 TaxID=675824 RepID=A0A1E3Q042_LIPST|nr:hypothetical protein LIPSTDRAFT_74692 [Lipomyces starkeyi NRRL Y-11557]
MRLLLQLPVLIVVFWMGFARGQAVGTTSTTTSSTSTITTLVWVTDTTTLANGVVVTTTIQAPFTQTYYSMYTSFYAPSSGSIGLGSHTGTIGVVKTPSETSSSAGLQSSGRNDRPVGLVACVAAAVVCVLLGTGSLFFM